MRSFTLAATSAEIRKYKFLGNINFSPMRYRACLFAREMYIRRKLWRAILFHAYADGSQKNWKHFVSKFSSYF